MPPSEQVTDLLDVLKNTRGSTIRSNGPEVSYRAGVSMVMRFDLPAGVTGWVRAVGHVSISCDVGDYSNMAVIASVYKR